MTSDNYSPDKVRWTMRLKSNILIAVDKDPKNAQRILNLHNISPEEIAEWRSHLARGGRKALRATKLHYYQPHRPRKPYQPKKEDRQP